MTAHFMKCFCILCLLFFGCLSPIGSTSSSLAASKRSKLQAKIEMAIRASGAEVAVAFRDLKDGREILLNPILTYHAASTMKVPVMMEVFRQVGAAKLALDDPLPIKNDFISIVDGSHFSIGMDSDSEPTLYRRIGQTATIRELVQLMITVSSNFATNILIEKVGAANVMELMVQLGAKDIRVLRGVEDSKAFQKGLNNTTTARDLMILLTAIAEQRAVSPAASDEMVKILLDQKFNESIPAGLPKEVRVAHKTGSITKINHDAAIVYPPKRKPYILIILTRGLEQESQAHKLMAEISRLIYEDLSPNR